MRSPFRSFASFAASAVLSLAVVITIIQNVYRLSVTEI